MPVIATLTLNPTIDSACEAEKVFPTHKVRTSGERYDPGGGGVNVARVLTRLGHCPEVIYLAGGPTGALLGELLDEGCLVRHNIPIQGATRMSLAVFERATGQEYRFVPEGPLVAEAEWQAALDFCAAIECEWLVASGSLPRGVPADFYARLSAILIRRGIRLIVDTSGAALSAVLEAGGVFLAKPSQGEFEALTGTTYASAADIGEAAMAFVRSGKVQHLTVTLGHLGAVMAYPGGVDIRPALPVEVKSATGAGDSFVAGILHGFARGEDATGAFRWGMAAGTAAVLTPGTDLCQSADIRRLHATMG